MKLWHCRPSSAKPAVPAAASEGIGHASSLGAVAGFVACAAWNGAGGAGSAVDADGFRASPQPRRNRNRPRRCGAEAGAGSNRSTTAFPRRSMARSDFRSGPAAIGRLTAPRSSRWPGTGSPYCRSGPTAWDPTTTIVTESGRAPRPFRMTRTYLAGVETGGTKILASLRDLDSGETIAEGKWATGSAEQAADDLLGFFTSKVPGDGRLARGRDGGVRAADRRSGLRRLWADAGDDQAGVARKQPPPRARGAAENSRHGRYRRQRGRHCRAKAWRRRRPAEHCLCHRRHRDRRGAGLSRPKPGRGIASGSGAFAARPPRR